MVNIKKTQRLGGYRPVNRYPSLWTRKLARRAVSICVAPPSHPLTRREVTAEAFTLGGTGRLMREARYPTLASQIVEA